MDSSFFVLRGVSSIRSGVPPVDFASVPSLWRPTSRRRSCLGMEGNRPFPLLHQWRIARQDMWETLRSPAHCITHSRRRPPFSGIFRLRTCLDDFYTTDDHNRFVSSRALFPLISLTSSRPVPYIAPSPARPFAVAHIKSYIYPTAPWPCLALCAAKPDQGPPSMASMHSPPPSPDRTTRYSRVGRP